MKIIPRQNYVDHIRAFLNKGLIIALTGQRRVGKSFILRQLIEEIKAKDPSANIIYINKEKSEFDDIKTHRELTRYLDERLKDDVENYVMIDEVQDIEGFEHTLRSLNADDECQIIVTGSNARMLSSELSTYLGGRHIDLHIQSLSYAEFLKFHKLEDSDRSLDLYLNYGGLPHLYRLGLENTDMIREYLSNIYNTIVLKDVIQREGIRNVTMFENLMNFVSDNVGQLVSANSLSKYLKSKNIDLTALTAINYLRSAENAYIIKKVNRYDLHGKRLLESNDKYYFEDLGLRNTLAGMNRMNDIEKLMENAVYLKLKEMGYKVSIGVLPQGEIDFVAQKSDHTVYIQVSYRISTSEVIDREYGNLLKINDNYPKYVVTMDNFSTPKDYAGIRTLSLRQFLLSEGI